MLQSSEISGCPSCSNSLIPQGVPDAPICYTLRYISSHMLTALVLSQQVQVRVGGHHCSHNTFICFFCLYVIARKIKLQCQGGWSPML